jgi:biopolymer transport protein ExbB/TolQ
VSNATVAISAVLARLRWTAGREHWAWTAAAVLFALPLLPTVTEWYVLLAALTILISGLTFGLITFDRASRAIERERNYTEAASELIERELEPAVRDSLDSERRRLPMLRNTFLEQMKVHLNCDTHKLAKEVFSEAECHRFASAPALVDQLEAARPDLYRGLRLVQVQALRAGILGTFVGLLLGLDKINGGVGNIGLMLEGMRTGFGTSIAGLVIACWAGFITHGLANRQRALRIELHAMLTSLLEIVSRATQTDEYFREIQQATAAMEQLKDRVSSRLTEVGEKLDRAAKSMASGPELWKRIAEALDKHAIAMEHVENAAANTVTTATTAFAAGTDRFEQTLATMRDVYSADTLRRVEEASLTRLDRIDQTVRSGIETLHTTTSSPLLSASKRVTAIELHIGSIERTAKTALWVAISLLLMLLVTVVALGWMVVGHKGFGQ